MVEKKAAPHVLVADDQPDVLEAIRLLLKVEGIQVHAVTSPAAALGALSERDYDVVLVDLNYTRDTTSGREGLDLLSSIQQIDATLPVVVMTAWASVPLAVEAMQRGARDFVQKPWENERLLAILRTQAELARALRQGERLEAENRLLRGHRAVRLVAESGVMKPVLAVIARIAPSDANVLLTGENGTGKGAVARAIHAASSRAARALVTVNAGGLSEGVFESELFGHERGAFTDAKAERVGRFELADGGTLFLDEIANVPLAMQPKLLRVVESGEFERVGSSRTRRADARLVSATNADIAEEVTAGRFRQDLFFRLNTVEIHLPPLRDRREDIPLLAAHFLKQHAEKYRKPITSLSGAALRALAEHTWPGNIRELDHAVERAVLMCSGVEIGASDLLLKPSKGSRPLEEMSLDEVEAHLIQRTLARFSGNVTLAASALGLSRGALYRRLEKLGISTGRR
jgi:DNA-binding NtrC family response regulator